MRAIFMNSEMSLTQPNRFRIILADKPNLKDPDKIWHWLI